MSSEITSHERALIDAAIAAGKVTRVPPGQSALWAYQWCPKDQKLKHVDTIAGIRHHPGFFLGRVQHGRKQSPEVAKRRAEVRRLHDAGLGRAEIAERLGTPYNTIVNDYEKLGLRPHPVPRQTRQMREMVVRLRQLEALLDDGTVRSAKELRAILGVREATFWDYMKRLGRRLPREVAGPRKSPETVIARRAEIREAHARGDPLVVSELARRYGKSTTVIYKDLTVLGIRASGGAG